MTAIPDTQTQQADTHPADTPNRAEPPSEAYLDRLQQVTEELTRTMEKTRIAEYVQYLDRPWKLIWTNFLIGIARGLGSTIGLAVVIAALVFFLQNLLMLNLPIISDFIADFILMVQENYNVLK